MQNSQLNRVIKLIKRTGDKTVIMDNESDAVMMLMDLGAYEKMLDNHTGVEKLTEEELMEKINRDVAIWRASNDNDKEKVETFDKVVPPAVVAENAPIVLNKIQDIHAEQEHSAADIVAEEEEEKFYLEPVE
ncbi:MAG: hypothetical protein AAB797_01375 [Patescibacteria group bacterium]